jgi:hypothetical protein
MGIEMSKEEFRKKFPHLAAEMEARLMAKAVGGVRWEGAENYDELRNPDAIAFIRRCDTEAQAFEIIAYLEGKGEISKDYAEKLRMQLKERGLSSFGTKKEPGYYFHKYYKRKILA